MRIAIVSAHYMPELGYQEIHLPRAYARLGHEVRVFSTVAVVGLVGKVRLAKYQEGLSKDPQYGYEVLRLPAKFWKSKAWSDDLKKEVLNYKPDVLIILGVAKIFPLSLLNHEVYHSCKVVSIYGDAKEYLDRSSFKLRMKAVLHEIGYKLIKEPLYKRAVKYSHRLVMNIPETNDYFMGFLNKKEKEEYVQKRLMLWLGYDPDEYFYDAAIRQEVRNELGIKDDEVAIITSTRIVRKKNLEKMISRISELRQQGKKVCYILVGFLNDDYEKELKRFIEAQPQPSIFKCFPFLKAKEINRLYCAADAGIWLKVAISIQEAMGTGLPVILENRSSMNHLMEHGMNGWYYEPEEFYDVIEKVTNELLSQKRDRVQLQNKNAEKLSYDSIATKIISGLKT